MPIDKLGIDGKICDALNEIISLNEILVEELTLARIQLASRDISIIVYHYPKMLKIMAKRFRFYYSLISDLVHPTIEIAHVISSVAKGNLSPRNAFANR